MRPQHYKRYPEHKDSGVEWLGEIPAHWEIAPLYARYEVALGKMLDSKQITGEYAQRYVRNVDVQWDSVSTQNLPEMDFAPGERARYRLRAGDLLVCEGGEVGRTAIWRAELEQCFYQKAIHRVRPRAARDIPRFLYYVMYTTAIGGVFTAGGNPNTIDHLTAVQLRHYRIAFAPESEQRAIAAFLDRETARIDALVAKKERLIELLQEKRTALISDCVTGTMRNDECGMRTKDDDGSLHHSSFITPHYKASGVEWLGEIPAHWEVKRLSRILIRITYGFTNPMPEADEGPYMLTALDIGDGGILYGNARRTTWDAFERLLTDKSRPRIGDLLLTKDGTLGRVAVADGEPTCINQSVALLRFDPSVDIGFIQHTLRAAPYQERMVFEAGGTAIKHIYISRLARMPVALPAKEHQRVIAAFLDRETAKIGALVAKIREAIELLKEYRTALISAAVTGKIDLNDECGMRNDECWMVNPE